MNEVKELILDKSKWICGSPLSQTVKEGNWNGDGVTELYNKLGFMCCLGQFSKQLNKEITDLFLLGKGNPAELGMHLPPLTDDIGHPSLLTARAININDNIDTTVKEKIKLLKALFKEHGYTIKVIN
jgi:hypothetical protein